jgi:hypothetical protein
VSCGLLLEHPEQIEWVDTVNSGMSSQKQRRRGPDVGVGREADAPPEPRHRRFARRRKECSVVVLVGCMNFGGERLSIVLVVGLKDGFARSLDGGGQDSQSSLFPPHLVNSLPPSRALHSYIHPPTRACSVAAHHGSSCYLLRAQGTPADVGSPDACRTYLWASGQRRGERGAWGILANGKATGERFP